MTLFSRRQAQPNSVRRRGQPAAHFCVVNVVVGRPCQAARTGRDADISCQGARSRSGWPRPGGKHTGSPTIPVGRLTTAGSVKASRVRGRGRGTTYPFWMTVLVLQNGFVFQVTAPAER